MSDNLFNPDDWKSRVDDPSQIANILNQYYGQKDPTGQGLLDDEYYVMLPQELQWLIEDQAEFRSLVDSYLKGDITYEELQNFELSNYGDAGTRFVEFYNEIQTMLTPEVERPEGAVDASELSEEQVRTFWPEIQESLEGLSETVIGPLGIPKSPEDFLDWIETVGEGVLDQNLGAPIVVVFYPTGAVDLELKIPVGFEINGEPIVIPIFDKDGNLVPVQQIGRDFVNEVGDIFRPIGDTIVQVGTIFTDGDGNIVADIIDAGTTILDELVVGEDGMLSGVLTEAIIGELEFSDGRWEISEDGLEDSAGAAEAEEVDGLEDSTDDLTADSTESDVDKDPSLPVFEEVEEEKEVFNKAPSGRVITDKRGNTVAIIGNDGKTYRLNEDNQWVADVAEEDQQDAGFSVSEAETTVGEGELDPAPVREQTYTEGVPEDFVAPSPIVISNGKGPVIKDPIRDDPIVDTDDDPIVDTDDDAGSDTGGDTSSDTGGDTSSDTGGDDDGLVGTGGDAQEDTQDTQEESDVPLTGSYGYLNDPDDDPEDPPLVGTGVPESSGGGGGFGGTSGGYMGGLSYQLPQFVGVQYQPKDYTVELNRIINESLFKGMI